MHSLYALGPYIPAINLSCPLTRCLQAGEIGLGTTTDKHACASLYRKPAQLHDPLHGTPLQFLSSVLSYTTVRIHRRCQWFDQHSSMSWSRVNPSSKTRVPI